MPLVDCRACASFLGIEASDDASEAVVRCSSSPVQITESRASTKDPPVAAWLHPPMTLAVREDVPLCKATALLVERGLSHLLIVDRDGQLLGQLRDLDLLDASTDLDAPSDRPVHQVMSSALSVQECTSVHDALVLLARSHLREIPVVTPSGRLLGIFRDLDGLHALAQKRRTKA